MVTLTYQERFKTMKGVFDAFTNKTLFQLQHRGCFDELISPVTVGKESNVFIAVKDGKKVIVKIYRVQNCDFHKMYIYIREDPRYEFLKKQRREIIFSWTQREYKNLLKAKDAKVRVPEALGWKHHILIEEMIGDDNPAPALKDSPPQDPKKFFNDVVKEMKKLYIAGLVHGDLSSFNILNHNEKPYLIDFSQATVTKSPNARSLLERDIHNITSFFEKLGVKTTFEETFKKVVGKSASDE